MEKRIEVEFEFHRERYIANVLIKQSEDGCNYIINLFDLALNKAFPSSYTFMVKDQEFVPIKPMTEDNLELVNAIKEAIRNHAENPVSFNG